MSGLRYWYAENRGTTFAFGLFVLMFAIYLFNYPSTLSSNVFQTAANKAVLLALVSMGQALVVLTAGIDLSIGMTLVLTSDRGSSRAMRCTARSASSACLRSARCAARSTASSSFSAVCSRS
jgi:predicted ABC-type sugar transport system permease subunit